MYEYQLYYMYIVSSLFDNILPYYKAKIPLSLKQEFLI